MGGLPQSGIALVAQGVGGFLGDVGRARGAVNDFDGATGKAAGGISGAFSAIGSAAGAVAKVVAGALVAAGVAAGAALGSSVNVAADFEQTLNVLAATSGASADDLDAVAQKAKELGADLTLPTTSATDAANVMLELSKAGFSVQESMDAAKGALQLAAAAGTDAATAAGIVAGAINAFNLEASEAVRIADLLAAGANASSASMTDLGQGLQQAGFAFAAAGLPVEDLVTSLAALTNVGLTGSDAGTALKNALMRLMNPTEKAAKLMASLGFSAYDAEGKMKPLPQLLSELNGAMAGMTEEERNATLGTIFLSDGMKAMIPLLALGDDGFLALKDSVTEQGAAADVAAAQTVGFKGAMAGLQSQVETLQLVIGQQLLPILTPLIVRFSELVSGVTTATEKFMTMLPTIMSSTEPFRALMQALTILNPGFLTFAMAALRVYEVLAPLLTTLADAGPLSSEFGEALSTLLEPLGITQAAIFTAQDALAQIGAAFASVAATLAGEFAGSVGNAGTVASELANIFLTVVLPAIADAAAWFAANLPAAIATGQAAFAAVAGFIQSIMPTIQAIIVGAVGLITAVWQQWGDEIQTIASGAWQMVQGVIEVVLGVIQGVIAVATGLITGDWQSQMGALQAANETIWKGIEKFLGGLLETVAGFFGTSLSEIWNTWQSNFNKMGALARTIVDRILETVGELAAKAAGIGQDFIDGIAEGITGALGGLVAAARGAAEAAVSAAKAALNIQSPSRVAADEIGKPYTQGIAMGLTDAQPDLIAALQATVRPLAQPNMAAIGLGGGGNVSKSYHLGVTTSQSPQVVTRSFAMMEALSA